jgi:proteasome lid subunit RPN8/RPN11
MAQSTTTEGAGEPRRRAAPVPPEEPARPALVISRGLLTELRGAARLGYPNEACGLLVGRNGGGSARIVRIHRARNLALARLRDRYTLDPESFLAADDEARRDGLDIVGIWHTHPDHPARPSATDRDAAWPGYTYLILSVHPGGVGAITAWRLEGNAFVEQPIEETES